MKKEKSEELHETNRYRDPDFPVGMYTVTREIIVPDGRGYMDLHWHEELQFTIVTDGQVHMQVNGTEYQLDRGQAIFINRNCLHMTTYLSVDGRYVSFNFPDKMLSFFTGSRMEQKDVRPVTGNFMLPAYVFREEVWHQEIERMLMKLIELFSAPSERLYEYRISMQLISIWYCMIGHVEEQLQMPSRGHLQKQRRMRAMLDFIHQNYSGAIRLKDIAGAASISEGECCRCFQELVRKSPNQYLLSYRLTRACELLNDTEKSVTEIACETGFSDTSHFIQHFKKRTGKTPKEYRRH